MLVRLKRDFFLGGHLYKASRFGVEIPAEVDGKPVVPPSAPKPKVDHWPLPKDAVVLSGPVEAKPVKDPQQALSSLNVATPKGFVDAMKNVDED